MTSANPDPAIAAASDRDEQRCELYGLLGDLPQRDRPIGVQVLSTSEQRGYRLEKLLLDLNGIEPVPAYFVSPPGPAGRRATVLYNHCAGGWFDLGKNELINGSALHQAPPYAQALTAMGCNALCIDQWIFGERRGRSESAAAKQMLWEGRVLWGMMVYDGLRAIDYLCARDDVDPSRIAALGLSMGSTMAWWLAALDERIKVCVDLCCLTDFQALIDAGGLDGHGIYYYVPRLLKHFSTASINALIAPRAHLSLAGDYDPLTPPAGLDRIDEQLRTVYAARQAPDKWRLLRYNHGHFECAAMRYAVMEFLRAQL